MKRMSITLAFLISLLVILWFFGVTIFANPQRAQFLESLPANINSSVPAAEPVYNN